MALSVVADLATGDVIQESWVDAVRINSNDQKTFAEGTAPFPGTKQMFGNSTSFYLEMSGGLPHIVFDTSGGADYLNYDRTNNEFQFFVGSAEKFRIDSGGLIQTAAFTSTEQTITNTSTANVAHGLGSVPRWVFARYATASGAISAATRVAVSSYTAQGSSLRIEQVGATNVVLINDTGATVYAWVFALL